VAIDISKVFDEVDHTLLIQQIESSPLHSNLVRWLSADIHGRTAHCLFRNIVSKAFIIHTGVPQGSVLSLALFNVFVSNFPNQAETNESYADDFNVGDQSSDMNNITTVLTEDLARVSQWPSDKNLVIAPEKSAVFLFTPDSHQVNFHPQVLLNGLVVPLD
jgi:hypothetical protein